MDNKTAAVYEWVHERDLWMTWLADRVRGQGFPEYQRWRQIRGEEVCIAPLVDSSQSGTCSGRQTFDHIHETPGGVKGRRAKTTRTTISCICQHHHLWTRWATSHRPEIRDYIKNANKVFERGYS